MNNIFGREYISKIDEEKTVLKGKETCELYKKAVQKRIRQISLSKDINSSSVLYFSGKSLINNLENKIIDDISWNDDQIGKFISFILDLEKTDKIVGSILKYKYLFGLTDNEISAKLKVSERTVQRKKNNAYYLVAVFSNQVQFIYENVYSFPLE